MCVHISQTGNHTHKQTTDDEYRDQKVKKWWGDLWVVVVVSQIGIPNYEYEWKYERKKW